jgi:hypothetical protein
MLACVNLAKAKVDSEQPEISKVANQINADDVSLGNKLVADLLELCYYTLPAEMASDIVEAGENF